ncbi:ABC transporter permease protein YxdM [Lachnospiraceae bacterium]|nr:ABC transporter permease protein YxdM [Lachnospiraceae bacterium]
MNKIFFIKLAAGNVKKNAKSYIPYILICTFTVTMFYIVKSLSLNPGLKTMIGADTLSYIMYLGSIVTALFAFLFLFYAYSFLIKRRKKEFGVFNILGMEKRHLAKTLAWETLYVSLISILGGIVFGLALDKAMFLLIAKIVSGKISLGFFISAQALKTTIILFAVIFLLIYLCSVNQIRMANPAELLRGGSLGEKAPKANYLAAILGILLVGAGYLISLTAEKPISKIAPYLFCAVVFVITGTYMLFTATSTVLLKTLQRQKNYYYKPKHFINISNMLYRMRQNAVGLANICIMSTMVLVMVSTTSSLVIGMDNIIKTQYPNDFDIYIDETAPERRKEAYDYIRQLQRMENLNVTEETYYSYLMVSAVYGQGRFTPVPAGTVTGESGGASFIFVSLDDYNITMHTDKTLTDGEILVYSNRKNFGNGPLRIFGKNYTVKETLVQALGNRMIAENEANSYLVVVPKIEEIYSLYECQREALGDMAANICSFYGFDTDMGEMGQENFYNILMDSFAKQEYQGTVESKADAKANQTGMYGGFFFIGMFFGILFTVAMVLIIYYKQISEGYDDKERFAIMQKVGMSRKEVKSTINSQVQTVFFLPVIVAGIHVAAAFPMIARILLNLNLRNTGLYVTNTIICYLMFAVLYFLVYLLTAKIYYEIIEKGGIKNV